MTTHHRTAGSLCALLVTLAVAGCGSTGATEDDTSLSPEQVAQRYGYDVGSTDLTPVYALVPQYRDPRDGYARDLLAARCLAGVVTYVAVPPGSADPFTDERTGQPLFTAEIAARWGYPALRGSEAAVDTAVPDEVEITDEIHASMVECGKAADERLGAVPERFLADVETAGWDAVPADPEVQAALAAWRECMAPAGVVDLPADPHEMPSPSVVGRTGGEEVDAGAGVPLSDREREVAVTDADCRGSSGYEEAVLQARAEAELAAIGRDLERFDASRRDLEAYSAGIDAVITELG